jgi:tetratricopeptide (TPR) repeat protein
VVTGESDLALDDRRRHELSNAVLGKYAEGDRRALEAADETFAEECEKQRLVWLELADHAERRFAAAANDGLALPDDLDALAWVIFARSVRQSATGHDVRSAFQHAEALFAPGARTAECTLRDWKPDAEWTWLSKPLRARYRVTALRGAMNSAAATAVLESEIRRREQDGEDLDHEVYETLAQLFDDQGADDRAVAAWVRAIELKPDGERTWRERLLVLARTQPADARLLESVRNAPPLDRQAAWDQARAMYPWIKAVTGRTREHVKDAIIAASLPTLRQRVVLAQWALALEHELIKRVFEPFREVHRQAGAPPKGRWTLSRWLANVTQYQPSLGDMATCLKDIGEIPPTGTSIVGSRADSFGS